MWKAAAVNLFVLPPTICLASKKCHWTVSVFIVHGFMLSSFLTQFIWMAAIWISSNNWIQKKVSSAKKFYLVALPCFTISSCNSFHLLNHTSASNRVVCLCSALSRVCGLCLTITIPYITDINNTIPMIAQISDMITLIFIVHCKHNIIVNYACGNMQIKIGPRTLHSFKKMKLYIHSRKWIFLKVQSCDLCWLQLSRSTIQSQTNVI